MSGSKPVSARPAASSPPPAKKMKLEDGPKFVDGELDEDLHSRQLAVYGRESMRRMATARVLVLGMKGLGVEVGECAGRLLHPRRAQKSVRAPVEHTIS